MKKICFVTHLPNLNGATRSLLDLLDGLDQTKFEPLVLINSEGPIIEELQKRNIRYRKTFYAPATNSTNKIKNIAKAVLNSSLVNRFSVSLVKKIFQEEKIDIVHNNSYLVSVGMQAAKELGIPYVCHLREFVFEDHGRSFFCEERQTDLLRNANAVIAITKAVKEKFQPDTPKEIIVLFDGIKVENYEIKPRELFRNSDINILMAGRISPGKGQLDSIKAVEYVRKKLPNRNIKLKVVGGIGDSDYYQKITGYVSENKLDFVEIHEFVSDLKKIRENTDIGLTCSSFEALGRVTVENMLSSLVTIGADSAGTLELIENGKNGYLYEKEDFRDLADKIIYAILNKENSEQLAKVAHDEAMINFDIKNYSRKLEDTYSKLI
ncbi:MAG: glycosyltransferase family 4 protein [Streptococcus gallolyticus]|uniref:Glycosyltransferase family 4 protein n=1 Tax=Streptococcus gallolyticus TaxID=315405 RepID=A0A928A3Z2_9STRE|nr:glycosyltransferase family 4 protein [Streptococcus gallolyticus]